jgi:hypothetical protein
MTQNVDRRARIVRVRTAESRIAQMELAKAKGSANQIRSIVDRIVALNNENVTTSGETDGMSLAAIAETRVRLDAALRATSVPLEQAMQRVQRQQKNSIHTELREQGARRLLEKAEVERAKHIERKAAHARCHPGAGNKGEEL